MAGGATESGRDVSGVQVHPEQSLRLPSTSVYDKTTKSPKKVSTYLGRLTQEAGLIPKGTRGTRHPLPGVNGGIKFPTR